MSETLLEKLDHLHTFLTLHPWRQGTFIKNGDLTVAVDWEDPFKSCREWAQDPSVGFCLEGAMYAITNSRLEMRPMQVALDVTLQRRGEDATNFVDFNDAKSTTKDDILKLIEDAIRENS